MKNTTKTNICDIFNTPAYNYDNVDGTDPRIEREHGFRSKNHCTNATAPQGGEDGIGQFPLWRRELG